MQLVVGRIIRPHGVRGEVSVEVRTDEPAHRFAAGAVLGTDPDAGPLAVQSSRWHTGRLLVSFAGITDRDRAAELRGTWLTVDSADVGSPVDPDEFGDHELIGLTVVTVSGQPVGRVAQVQHHGQDLLVIEPGGVLVPFVAAIVPEVDVAAGRLVIDPPPGLLELGATEPGPG